MALSFQSLCTPAKIYLVLAIIFSGIALYNNVMITAVLVKLIFAFVWTYILSWLCKKDLTGVAWFLVLLPYILILLALFQILN
jgi:hypothetical protein